MNSSTSSQSTSSYEAIKLGIDAHAKYYWVSRQVDGATPQPVQKMTYDELLLFVVKQQKLTGKVVTCYEAGAFGFHLHRRLEELGIKNYVVQPQNWDELGKGVKNDRLDAAALCQRLDRYELGNKKAFSTVRIPTVDEERERAMSRQRQQLMRERQRVAAMGRSLLATHNIHVTGKWWKGKAWTAIKVQAPAWVIERLEVFIVILGPLEEQEVKLMKAIQEAAKEQKIPKGVGPLTFEILRREVGDWKRFNNRRQVSSYTGLCPREHSSGGKRRSGSVSKSGNPRVRAMLVEMVWRMMHWQPEYKPLQKWAPVLYSPTPNAAAKNKAVVAIARQLAVDLWRVFTGQVEAEKSGLVYLPEAA
jgi:transposase